MGQVVTKYRRSVSLEEGQQEMALLSPRLKVVREDSGDETDAFSVMCEVSLQQVATVFS